MKFIPNTTPHMVVLHVGLVPADDGWTTLEESTHTIIGWLLDDDGFLRPVTAYGEETKESLKGYATIDEDEVRVIHDQTTEWVYSANRVWRSLKAFRDDMVHDLMGLAVSGPAHEKKFQARRTKAA